DGIEFDYEEDVALKTACEWQVNRAARIAFKQAVTRCRDDPGDLDRFARFDRAAFIVTGRRGSLLCALRCATGKLDSLSERVAIRPKLLRQNCVDDRHRRTAAQPRFRRGESAPAEQRQTDGREIIRADAVPGRAE